MKARKQFSPEKNFVYEWETFVSRNLKSKFYVFISLSLE